MNLSISNIYAWLYNLVHSHSPLHPFIMWCKFWTMSIISPLNATGFVLHLKKNPIIELSVGVYILTPLCAHESITCYLYLYFRACGVFFYASEKTIARYQELKCANPEKNIHRIILCSSKSASITSRDRYLQDNIYTQ